MPLLLAIDLGTTTLHWSALTPDGRRVTHGAELNPPDGRGQRGHVPSGRGLVTARPAALRRLTLAAVARIAGLPGPVRELCGGQSSAMTAILLGRDVSGLAAAPYRLDYAGGTVEILPGLADLPGSTDSTDSTGLPGSTGGADGADGPEVWIPPQPAPFVGGDVGAGMTALLYGGLAAVTDVGAAASIAGRRARPGPRRNRPAFPSCWPTGHKRGIRAGHRAGQRAGDQRGSWPRAGGHLPVLRRGGPARAIASFTPGPAGLVPTVLSEDDGTPPPPPTCAARAILRCSGCCCAPGCLTKTVAS